jgi:hypothetical protein
MKYLNKYLQKIILICLLVAVIGTGYIFILSIIFKDKTHLGFFNTWQFPMLLAIYVDAAYYKLLV